MPRFDLLISTDEWKLQGLSQFPLTSVVVHIHTHIIQITEKNSASTVATLFLSVLFFCHMFQYGLNTDAILREKICSQRCEIQNLGANTCWLLLSQIRAS